MKKFLRNLTAFAMAAVMSIGGISAQAADFKDVKPGAWYYNAVQYSSANNLFAGTSPTTFSPDAAVTRGMFVTVLGKMSQINTGDYLNNRYKDVPANAYYAPYIEWATSYGIVSGTGNNKFEPEAKITRQQMATILYNYADVAGNDTSVEWGGTGFLWYGYKEWYFADGRQADWYAHDALEWCVEHGILAGNNGLLTPKATATRAQCAQILYNARNKLTVCTDWTGRYDEDGHYDPNGNYDVNGWLRYLPNGEPVNEVNVTRYIDSLRDVFPEGPSSWDCVTFSGNVWDNMGVLYNDWVDDPSWEDLKPGDILTYATTANPAGHVVVIVEKDSDYYRVVEGSYGGTIHWDRKFTKDDFNDFTYRYLEKFY